MHKSALNCANLRKSARICTSLHESARVYANLCEFTRNCASLRETARVYVKLCESMRICASLCKSAQVYANLREYARVYANLSESTQICTSLRETAREIGWVMAILILLKKGKGQTNRQNCLLYNTGTCWIKWQRMNSEDLQHFFLCYNCSMRLIFLVSNLKT